MVGRAQEMKGINGVPQYDRRCVCLTLRDRSTLISHTTLNHFLLFVFGNLLFVSCNHNRTYLPLSISYIKFHIRCVTISTTLLVFSLW